MLFLLLLLFLGLQVGERVLREPDRRSALTAGLGTTVVVFMLVVNLLGRHVPIGQAARWGCLVLVLMLPLLLRLPPGIGGGASLGRAARCYLWAGTAFVYAYSTLVQNISIDDDYWVHAPLMGLLKNETLPPVNPFFRDVQLNGHYGRDLLIASLSSLTGMNVLRVQLFLGTACAVLTFLLLFSLVFNSTRSEISAVLATALATFGVNVGVRPGSIDTLQNNNPIVYLLLVLFLLLYHRASDPDSPRATVLACGLTLGVLAFTYETHFGLCVLAVLALTVARWLRERDGAWRRSALVLLVGTAIALTQGGTFTELARKLLSPPRNVSARLAAEAGAEQQVSLQFPRERLLYLHLAEGDFRRISCGYQTFSFLLPYFPIAEGYPYAPLWSRDVLQIHWLATYLGPLGMVYAWRFRLYALLWLGLFAVFAFLTPALVGFGPVFEFEYFRWHYAAGWGFAACLGGTLGHLCERRGSFSARAVSWVVTGALTLLCLAPFCWRTLPKRIEAASGLGLRWTLFVQPTGDWLRYHNGSLGVLPNDTRMADALRTMARPGEAVLVNMPAYGQSAVLLSSTLSGLTSLPFAGHSLPTSLEAVETTPYRMSPVARAFWGSLDPFLLGQLGVKWLYLRPGPEIREDTVTKLSRLTDLRERANFQDSNGPYRLYQVATPPAPSPRLGTEPLPIRLLSLRWGGDRLERSRYYQAEAVLRNEGVRDFAQGSLIAYQWSDRPGDRERVIFRLQRALPAGGSLRQTIPLVAPHAPGEHILRMYLGMSPDAAILHPIGAHPDTISVY